MKNLLNVNTLLSTLLITAVILIVQFSNRQDNLEISIGDSFYQNNVLYVHVRLENKSIHTIKYIRSNRDKIYLKINNTATLDCINKNRNRNLELKSGDYVTETFYFPQKEIPRYADLQLIFEYNNKIYDFLLK